MLGAGGAAMKNLDHFFDSYDRLFPQWFSDVLITAMIVVPLVWMIA
jgi:hypothetical protein